MTHSFPPLRSSVLFGAERRVCKGDMLFLGPTSSTPARIQGSWVTEEEVRAIAAHWKRQAPQVTYVEDVQGDEGGDAGMMLPGGGTGDEDDDDLALQAMEQIGRATWRERVGEYV